MAEVTADTSLPSVGGTDAGYLFEFNNDGVFLTVYPSSATELLFELRDLQKVLKEHGIEEYEMEALARAMREQNGDPVKLAERNSVSAQDEAPAEPKEEPPEEPKEEPKIRIDISRDKMSATLSFEMNENSKLPTVKMVLQEIEKKGITFGIDHEKIEQAVSTQASDCVVAQGILPENGTDAVIKKHFSLEGKGKPIQGESARVDYKDLNLFVLVSAGDLLAERIMHTPGVPGTNIFGDAVAPRPGKPKPLPSGKNTKIVDDTIVAAIDGQVIENGKKIAVDPLLNIKGDVDMSTGNIDFNGSVNIKGSVQAGFFVCAVGDVEISGTVSGGIVEARNITVIGGVQGMNRGHLRAVEDFRASFAENANIIAERDVYISDVMLHSEIHAGRKIIVEGHRGQIMGGTAVAGEEIRAKTIGNTMNVSTKLEVGVNPMLREKYNDLRAALATTKAQLDKIQKTLQTLNHIDKSRFSQEKLDQFAQMTRVQFTLAGQIQRDEKELTRLQESLEIMKTGKIKVADKAYPGVKLVIGSIMKTLQSEAQRCTFYVDEAEDLIRTGAY